MSKISEYKNIFFSGIGGCGMSGLAQLLAKRGQKVSGSNDEENVFTTMVANAGVPVVLVQQKENITEDIDLFIYTSAIGPDHPERARAENLGITSLNYFEALAELSREYKTVIAVSGDKGKTSTTALVACMLQAAKLPVSAVVGSIVNEWGTNYLRNEQSEYLVVEACEHMEHMRLFRPNIMVVTNIAADHLDYYGDLAHIQKSFAEWASELPATDWLVANADDENSAGLRHSQTLKFSLEKKGDINAENISIENGALHFSVLKIGECSSVFPGYFNIANSLAAIAVGKILNIKPEIIVDTINNFRGTARRFEKIGEINQAPVYSDYAHNPLSLNALFTGVKELFPGKRLVVAFEPHQHARTKLLYPEFVAALSENIDVLIVQKIYGVTGREEQQFVDVSSRKLFGDLEKFYDSEKLFYSDSNEETLDKLKQIVQTDDLVLIVGAGTIDLIRNKL